jgi:hypothetical protein
MPSICSGARARICATCPCKTASTGSGVSCGAQENGFYDHVEQAGEDLFRLACERDLEGIVTKRRFDPYLPDVGATWFKIRNRDYSQGVGREELFERERGSGLEWEGWSPACWCAMRRMRRIARVPKKEAKVFRQASCTTPASHLVLA